MRKSEWFNEVLPFILGLIMGICIMALFIFIYIISQGGF